MVWRRGARHLGLVSAAALLGVQSLSQSCSPRVAEPLAPPVEAAGAEGPTPALPPPPEDADRPGEAHALNDRGPLRQEEHGAIRSCPTYFEEPLRSAWHHVTGEEYFIDAVGRPSEVEALVPPFDEDGRIESCQTEVGHWGRDVGSGSVYHGGHMLGCQLGGWGGRANMVPLVGSFKTGNWLQLENAIHDCGNDLTPGRLRVRVKVGYVDATTLIPDEMSITMTDTLDGGDTVTITFQNERGGGPGGTEERLRGVEWLRALGCATDAKVKDVVSPRSNG